VGMIHGDLTLQLYHHWPPFMWVNAHSPMQTEGPQEYYTAPEDCKNRGFLGGAGFRSRCNWDNRASCTNRKPPQGYYARLDALDGAVGGRNSSAVFDR